jgi:dihydroneopterin aldolase
MPTSVVFINNLVINTLIGIYPREKKAKQSIILDLELTIDRNINPTLLKNNSDYLDNLDNTIDYEALSNWLIDQSQLKQFNLIETLAEYLCTNILINYQLASKVKLKITKPNALQHTKDVGVVFELAR